MRREHGDENAMDWWRSMSRSPRAGAMPSCVQIATRSGQCAVKRYRASPLLLTAALVLVAGCGVADHDDAALRDGDCWHVGNRADRIYCATTYTQLLAHPERYDGRRIQIQGRAAAKDVIEVYPSLDSFEGNEIQASLSLRSGDQVPELRAYLLSPTRVDSASRVVVMGVFHLNRTVPVEKRQGVTLETIRLGSLELDDFKL